MNKSEIISSRFTYKEIVVTALLVLSFAILYSHTIFEMAQNWMSDDNFSHGFLIPVISGFMIWKHRNKLIDRKITSASWGIVIVLFAMVMHIIGGMSAEVFTMRTSMIVCICGTVIFLFGLQFFKDIMIPIMYLIFMIPIPKIIWNQISFPLQMAAAKATSSIIDLVGIANFREGNIIHLSNTSLQVVDACSGLRSLTTMLALTAAFSYLSNLKRINKCLLFSSAIPVAIFLNITRLTITAIFSQFLEPEITQGLLHDISGFVILLFGVIIIYCIKNMFERMETK